MKQRRQDRALANNSHPHLQRGFTIVELLIVIVVIAILAAITIVAYNGVQARARDSRRANDLASIKTAVLTYDAINGGVPGTATYGSSGIGGWDYSTLPNWLSFLRSTNGNMPVDPINQAPTTDPQNDGRTYFYYCYTGSPSTVAIGYLKDAGGLVKQTFTVNACL